MFLLAEHNLETKIIQVPFYYPPIISYQIMFSCLLKIRLYFILK